jgi:hypothetical protein
MSRAGRPPCGLGLLFLVSLGAARFPPKQPAIWGILEERLSFKGSQPAPSHHSNLTRFLEDFSLDGLPEDESCTISPAALEFNLCGHMCPHIHIKIGKVAKLVCLLSIILTLPVIGTGPPLMFQVFPRVCPVSSFSSNKS